MFSSNETALLEPDLLVKPIWNSASALDSSSSLLGVDSISRASIESAFKESVSTLGTEINLDVITDEIARCESSRVFQTITRPIAAVNLVNSVNPATEASPLDPVTGISDTAQLVGATSATINFQPAGATVPTGYTKDTGAAYDATRGYGWVRQDSLSSTTHVPLDITPNTRDRNRVADQRLDTLIHMQDNASNSSGVKTPAAWEYKLDNGTYNVTVSVGDAAYFDSQHTINVEGAKAIDLFKPSSTQKFKNNTVTVNVTDGKLTIDARGGTNTKLNYIDIAKATSDFTAINWSNAASSPIGRTEAQGIVANGKLYTFGGYVNTTYYPTRRADAYDPATNKWARIADLPKPLSHGAVAVDTTADADGTDIYLAGGYLGQPDGSGQIFATKDVWKYNINANKWTAIKPLLAARGSGALELLGRELHFFGGADSSRADKGSHWALNLDSPTSNWVAKAALPNPRSHLGDATLGGKIYAIGGQHGVDSRLVTQNSVHTYNPRSNSWTAVESLPRGRSHIGAATFVMDGRIIVAGGEIAHGSGGTISDVTAYSPSSNSWTTLTPLPATRHSGVAGSIRGQLFYTTGAPGFKTTTYKGIPA